MATASTSSFINAKARSQAKVNGTPHQARRATAKTETVDESEQIHADFHARAQEFSANYERATAKRRIVAWTLGLISFAGTASAALHLLGYAVLGAMLLSGSSFVATMIYLIGMVIAIYASLIAMNQTVAYVVSSRPEHHWAMVKSAGSRIAAYFKRDDEVLA